MALEKITLVSGYHTWRTALANVIRDRPNLTGLRWAPAARSYLDNEGPDIVGVYLPWVVDLMPTASWLQLFFGVSILLNARSL